MDTKKKLIQSINGALTNTFSSTELKSVVSSRFHLSYISQGPSKEFEPPKVQITSETMDKIVYNNKKLSELKKVWNEIRVVDANKRWNSILRLTKC